MARGVFCQIGRRLCRLLDGAPLPLVTLFAGATMVSGAIVRAVCGSPYRHGVTVLIYGVIPPVWLMTLLWTVWYGLLGAALAVALFGGGQDACSRAQKYRGGMLFLCMLFCGFLWYPLFFSAGNTLLAALLAALVLLLCILSALCWRNTARSAAMLLFLHAAFLVWMVLLNIRALLHV